MLQLLTPVLHLCRKVLTQYLRNGCNEVTALQCNLSRWSEYKRLWTTKRQTLLQPFQTKNSEDYGLSGAGLRLFHTSTLSQVDRSLIQQRVKDLARLVYGPALSHLNRTEPPESPLLVLARAL